MDKVGDLILPFRRGRDYVQGAELCDAMLAAVADKVSDLSFSAHDMLRVHGAEMFALAPDEVERLADFPVRLRLRGDAENRHFVLRPVADVAGPEELEDHEAEIWTLARRDGEAIAFEGLSPLPPLGTAVSLKKRLMLDLFPERRGKWIFCRLDAPAPPPAACPRITVRFRQAIRNIHLSEVTFGDSPPARMQFMVTA